MLPRTMLLLRTNTISADREVWTARTGICADAGAILRALTDPDSIAEWAPVSFEVAGLAGGLLHSGSREQVTGSIAGITTTFDIEVGQADTERLELVARGPVTFEVSYRFRERDADVLVEATVGVRRQRGLAAQILRAAVTTLLNAGALTSALRRLNAAVSCAGNAQLAAA